MLLETDQTFCFDHSGRRTPCGDAVREVEARHTDPAKRFDVQGEQVRDQWTGLTWHIDANLPEFPQTWPEAFEFIEEMNRSETAGLNGWRLPTRREFFSLISHQQINPCLPVGHPFRNVFNGYYWTQTQCARLPGEAWYLHLGGGRVYRGMKHGSYMVWPVAGTKLDNPGASLRFRKQADCIHDALTHRTWLDIETPGLRPVTWSQAIQFIEHLNDSGEHPFNDWRLPNIRELESLVDTESHSPAFSGKGLWTDVREGYWSSTTSIYEPRYAWVLYSMDGAVGVGFKSNPDFFVLPVRNPEDIPSY